MSTAADAASCAPSMKSAKLPREQHINDLVQGGLIRGRLAKRH